MAVLEAFQFQLATPQGRQEGTEDHAGYQSDVEIPWLAWRGENQHQHVGGRAGEAQALNRDDVEGLCADLVGHQPGQRNHQPDAAAAQPLAPGNAGPAGKVDGGCEPGQTEEQAANVAEVEEGKQVARGATIDGHPVGNRGAQW